MRKLTPLILTTILKLLYFDNKILNGNKMLKHYTYNIIQVLNLIGGHKKIQLYINNL